MLNYRGTWNEVLLEGTSFDLFFWYKGQPRRTMLYNILQRTSFGRRVLSTTKHNSTQDLARTLSCYTIQVPGLPQCCELINTYWNNTCSLISLKCVNVVNHCLAPHIIRPVNDQCECDIARMLQQFSPLMIYQSMVKPG